MVMSIYTLASLAFVIIGIVMLFTGRYLWSMPFFGGALSLYFMGMSNDSGPSGGAR